MVDSDSESMASVKGPDLMLVLLRTQPHLVSPLATPTLGCTKWLGLAADPAGRSTFIGKWLSSSSTDLAGFIRLTHATN